MDLLRACAVLMVLLDHVLTYHGWQIASFLPGVTNWGIGRTGVLLFFVHTSLVLMASLERGGGRRPRWVRDFYIRRAFRIYPLAIAVVVFAVVCSIPSSAEGTSSVAPHTMRVVGSNLLLMQNLTGARNVQGVLWSLPLEVQMYVVLPLCYLVAVRGPRFVLGLLALGIAGWAAVRWEPHLWRLEVLSFAPVFLLGVLAFACLVRWPTAWDVRPSRLTDIAKSIATYSYGVYLLHIPALWLAFRVLHAPAVVQWAAFATLLPVFVWVGYHAIEHPMIEMARRGGRPAAMTPLAEIAAP